jgi:hypothetical protein
LGALVVTSIVYADLTRSALLLHFHWGKTLRDGSKHLLRVERRPDLGVGCPVSLVSQWVAAARRAGWDMDEGVLFSPIDALTAQRLPGAGPQAEANARFVTYLQRWGLWEGETLHGLRGGGVVSFTFSAWDQQARTSARELARSRARWAGGSMLEHYTALDLVQEAAGPTVLRTVEEYEALDDFPLRFSGVQRRPYML